VHAFAHPPDFVCGVRADAEGVVARHAERRNRVLLPIREAQHLQRVLQPTATASLFTFVPAEEGA
jgi:hypothetical protein